MVVLGNAIIRHTELVCGIRWDSMSISLLGTEGADLRRVPDKLLSQSWGQLLVVVHIDTSDVGKKKKAMLEVKCRLLGRG